MSTKLICSDIDGTLLNKERELSERTINIIKKLSQIPFILISSRMPKAMQHLQEELGISHLPMIAYNGALIIDQNKILHSTEIPISSINKIVNFCKNTSLHISLYHNNEWYVPELDFWAKREWNNTKVKPSVQELNLTVKKWGEEQKGAHKIMIMGEEKEIDLLEKWLENNVSKSIIGYRSKASYLEIAPKVISKKTAIQALFKHKYSDISFAETTAFGDNYNDIEMLKAVNMGVAVSNAKAEVLAIADAVTNSNKEDGVAVFLEEMYSKLSK